MLLLKMNEQQTIENDYQQGLQSETEIMDKLQKKGFHVESSTRYEWYDFKLNQKYLCENKKRNIAKNKYDTTIFPLSKIQQFKKVKYDYKDLILIFSFTDNDYYTTYNEICKKKHNIQIKPFTRYCGFRHTSRKHLFIPTNMLQPLDQLILE